MFKQVRKMFVKFFVVIFFLGSHNSVFTSLRSRGGVMHISSLSFSPLFWRGVGGEDRRLVRRGKIQVTEILKEASIQTYVNEFKIDCNDGVCPLLQTEQKKREKSL